MVYTLDATLTGVSGDGNWLGMGFATGQSTSADPTFNRFLDHDTVGRTWMIVRGGLTNNSAFMDSNSSNIVWDSGTAGGDFDLRVVLDTTGGTGNWTATWYAKRPVDASYTEVRPETTLDSESITSVGLTKSNTGVTGNVISFELTGPQPAPHPMAAYINITPIGVGYATAPSNVTSFSRDNLMTVGDQQFATYYEPEADGGNVIVARRTIGLDAWTPGRSARPASRPTPSPTRTTSSPWLWMVMA